MEKIIMFGARGNAKIIVDMVEKQNLYQLVGFFTYIPGKIGTELLGYPVLGGIDGFFGSDKGIVAFANNHLRHTTVNRILQINPDFKFVNIIHPGAIIGKNVQMGYGNVVVGGAVINPLSKIGNHSIIMTRASVGHDVKIGDFSTIGSGATIGGNVEIGNLTTVALGANVIHKVKIGSGTLVGAGSTVVRNIPDGVLAYGVPAKVIRPWSIEERIY